MTVSAIARRTGLHEHVAKYLARGIEPPAYGPRSPPATDQVDAIRALPARAHRPRSRLYREIRELGYAGGYTVLKDFLRQVRPQGRHRLRGPFRDARWPPGAGGFRPFPHGLHRRAGCGADRLVVLVRARPQPDDVGPLRIHQDMQTLLRCHAEAFAALGGVPAEILYDRMRTVFRRDDIEGGHIVYNATLRAFAAHYSYQPKACVPIAPKRKAKWSRHSATCARTSF